MPILKLINPNMCHGMRCEMPEPDLTKYGAGTIASCGQCGKQAKLVHGTQREPDPGWMWLAPEDYIDV